MKKHLFHNILPLFIALLSCSAAFSQEKADSLMKYVEIAVQNNPTVLQRYKEYQAALQKVPQVGSFPDPQLELGIYLSPMELVGGNQVADIKLMQMFPWFGVLKNAKDEMSLMAKAKYETFRDAKWQVFYDVQRAAYELQKNRIQIHLTEKNLNILKTIEQLAIVRFKAGSASGNSASAVSNLSGASVSGNASGSSGMSGMGGSGVSPTSKSVASMSYSGSMGATSGSSGLSDIYRIQIEMNELENNIALLINQEKTIEARFNGYLNRPARMAVTLSDTMKPVSPDPAFSEVSDSMFARNPMLSMLQYEQQSISARSKMVKQMGYPMVGVGINYSVISKNEMSTSMMNGKDMMMPMVTMSLPVYRKKYKSMQKETDFQKMASEQNYQATENALKTEFYEALQLYEDAQRRIKLYDNQSALAQKSLDILIRNFSTSSAGLTEILSVRQQLLDYELKQAEAVTDYNTAVAWIKRLKPSGDL